jgi:hypothetical protein
MVVASGQKLVASGPVSIAACQATRIRAAELFREDHESGKGLSAKVFQEEYCSPFRHAEKWIEAKRKYYGALSNSISFTRTADFLFTPRGRLAVLSCLRSGIKLDGISDQQPGIEHCRALIKDLEIAKACGQPQGASPQKIVKEEVEGFERLIRVAQAKPWLSFPFTSGDPGLPPPRVSRPFGNPLPAPSASFVRSRP